jgi:Na+-driven multidrug efflux pump
MSVNAAFNGIGKPLPGVAISTCRVIVVFLPLALLGKHFLGIQGLFLATLLSNLLMGAVAYAWLGHQIARSQSEAG